jgi:Arc/MetJ family transcription regulator
MKRSIDLDEDLAAEIEQAASLIREKSAVVMRLALRAGLPAVTSRLQSARPPGYLAQAYQQTRRAPLENAHGKALRQRPER